MRAVTTIRPPTRIELPDPLSGGSCGHLACPAMSWPAPDWRAAAGGVRASRTTRHCSRLQRPPLRLPLQPHQGPTKRHQRPAQPTKKSTRHMITLRRNGHTPSTTSTTRTTSPNFRTTKHPNPLARRQLRNTAGMRATPKAADVRAQTATKGRSACSDPVGAGCRRRGTKTLLLLRSARDPEQRGAWPRSGDARRLRFRACGRSGLAASDRPVRRARRGPRPCASIEGKALSRSAIAIVCSGLSRRLAAGPGGTGKERVPMRKVRRMSNIPRRCQATSVAAAALLRPLVRIRSDVDGSSRSNSRCHGRSRRDAGSATACPNETVAVFESRQSCDSLYGVSCQPRSRPDPDDLHDATVQSCRSRGHLRLQLLRRFDLLASPLRRPGWGEFAGSGGRDGALQSLQGSSAAAGAPSARVYFFPKYG